MILLYNHKALLQKVIILLSLALIFPAKDSIGQSKKGDYLGNPVWTDTLSTLFFPIQYKDELIAFNSSDRKIAVFGNYFANMVAYNFKTDQYHTLFDHDTFIEAFILSDSPYGYASMGMRRSKFKNVASKWVFLLVKNTDLNGSGRIDENDPSILFVTTSQGEHLKQVTEETENVVSFDVFESQGFALLKIQRDSNGDKSFKAGDKDFYFKKVDLNNLLLGQRIEVK